MKLAVITPIGPGHEESYKACRNSIEQAWAYDNGPFSHVVILPQWDLEGANGRSASRNKGLQEARQLGCEWVFFIDADDIMTQFAFADVKKELENFDAIWGVICEAPYDDHTKMQLRPGQLLPTQSIDDLVDTDPYLSIQMGHFARTELAESVGFDQKLDSGEDFKYYLEMWRRFRCCKTSSIFFVNKRGNHSKGKRSSTGSEWRSNVEKIIFDYKTNYPKNEKSVLNSDATILPSILIPEGPTAIVVAYPDDEVLWAGGLLSRYKGFDVICCSIPRKDPERLLGFFSAIKLLGHYPIVLPFTESDPNSELNNLDLIDLSSYSTVITHNEFGEYGHKHHIQVHNHVKNNYNGLCYFFGYKNGDCVINLSPDESQLKISALKCYDNISEFDLGLPKWKALLDRYQIEFDKEKYVTRPAQFSIDSACGSMSNQEIRARSDYQIFDIANSEIINVGERIAKKLIALEPIFPNFSQRRVLDIGCDFGFWSFLAATRGASVVVLDRSRPVRDIGRVNIPLLNNQTAKINSLNAMFIDYEAGSQWWDFQQFDIVFCMSVYHHIFNICKNHETIWYWLSRVCKGELIWENPLESDDTVVKINISLELQKIYNESNIRKAALKYFSIDYEGPAIHETTRTVWRLTPKVSLVKKYVGQAVPGAGGATKAFMHAGNRRLTALSNILGKPIYPGTLNIILQEDFDWNNNFFRAILSDVINRSSGLQSEWGNKWVRLYPLLINGMYGWGMRFEQESYPNNFMEIIASTKLRDHIENVNAIFIEVELYQ